MREMIHRDRPQLLILSPPCTLFSNLQNLSGGPNLAEYMEAVRLWKVALRLIDFQVKQGGLFLLEHPQSSAAWRLDCSQQLAHIPGVIQAITHMCQFGMKSRDEWGEGLVMKPTRFVTNAPAIAEKLARRCPSGHRHVPLLSGRARAAEEYPPELCDAILEGLEIQDSHGKVLQQIQLNRLELRADMCDPQDFPQGAEDWSGDGGVVTEESEDTKKRDQKLIAEARQSEMKTFWSIPVYDYVPAAQALADTDGIVVDTTWVDVNKGSQDHPDWRSRLCAREFAWGEARDDLFSPTPPLAATKLLLSELASRERHQALPTKRALILDVKRAFLYGKARRRIYLRLPA